MAGGPALFAGSLLGIVAFRNINEIGFRRTIPVLLLCQALRSLWLDCVITAEGSEAFKIDEHWPKES
jgi:uncharacterized membrane protein YfcA